MNKKLLILLLLCFSIFFSCSGEEKDWKYAESENSIAAYENYLKQYPQGKFVDEARPSIEKIYFEKAKAADTIEAYEEFLKRYAEGDFADKAHSKIEVIYFDQAKAANSVEACDDFLKRYPEGEYAYQARQILEEIYPSFSKDKVLKIESISSIVGTGEISFTKGSKPNTLKITLNATTPVVNGNACMFCGALIRIAPNLKVPIRPFFIATKQPGATSMSFNTVIQGPISAEATKFIISGPQGAILKKKGNGFRLVEGEAHFLTEI
jgi:tetratricopeptide (TPR) repeat protein